MDNKSRSTLYYLLVLSILAILFIVAGVSYFKNKPQVNSNASDSTKTTNEPETNASDDQETKIENLSGDQKLYAQAIKSLENKDYQQATDYLNQAIAENPNVVSYYSLKSEAEVLADKKNDAKATLEAGLKIDSESEILHSKLDVLNKENFSPADQDNPRQ